MSQKVREYTRRLLLKKREPQRKEHAAKIKAAKKFKAWVRRERAREARERERYAAVYAYQCPCEPLPGGLGWPCDEPEGCCE